VPLRITSATTKVGIVLVATIATFVAGVLVGGATDAGDVPAAATALALTALLVVFCGRTFRGEDEPVGPPRPWWRLTGGVPSSAFVAGLFLWQVVRGLWTTATGGTTPGTVLLLVGHVLLAAAYVHSALRQRPGRT